MSTPLPHPDQQSALAWAALDGLMQAQKSISSTWLYDGPGSKLFEQITDLDEYYPTRTEIDLLHRHAHEMADAVGSSAVVVEIGSGSSRKTPLLLRHLDRPRAYIPVDIARHCLDASVAMLADEFPELPMYPLVADFNQPFRLPAGLHVPDSACLVFFPGSTIGNFDPSAARAFLRRIGNSLGPRSAMLVGVDPTRDPAVLIPAYDDAKGVTAAFNLNLLARLNRELDCNFDLGAFRHEARYNAEYGRIEMHLISRRTQTVRLLGQNIHIAAGESIHTENSYKYPIEDFQTLAHSAGWQATQVWCAGNGRFCIHLLKRARPTLLCDG